MSSKVSSEKITLANVQMLEGSVTTTPKFREHGRQPAHYHFTLDREFLFNPEQSMVVVQLSIALSGLAEDGQSPLGINAKYDYQFFFRIENMDDFISNDKVIHPELVTTLLSISYSTLRGIVLERTSSTFLGSVILPVVSPLKLLKDDNKSSGQVQIKPVK